MKIQTNPKNNWCKIKVSGQYKVCPDIGKVQYMNKTKRVAWHKHLKGKKKFEEKQKAQKANATPTTTPSTPVRAR
ncbi:MAG: hypothetical protein PVS3B3_09150 [Ktedonobacteraceae bacterium]